MSESSVSTEKLRMARNITTGMQIRSDATGEWLTVAHAMRVDVGGVRMVTFRFADGTRQSGSPEFKIMSRGVS